MMRMSIKLPLAAAIWVVCGVACIGIIKDLTAPSFSQGIGLGGSAGNKAGIGGAPKGDRYSGAKGAVGSNGCVSCGDYTPSPTGNLTSPGDVLGHIGPDSSGHMSGNTHDSSAGATGGPGAASGLSNGSADPNGDNNGIGF